MSASDAYAGRVQATVWQAAEYVGPEALAEVQRLVDHGEPAESMSIQAWVIVNEKVRVPRQLIASVRELSEELVPPEDLPPDLDDYAVD